MLRLTLLIPLLLLLSATVQAHNWMLIPAAYKRFYRRVTQCNTASCRTACQPRARGQGPGVNSRANPYRTYRRGEEATIRYSRNNHRGGFLRMALVPVDKMMSREWHTRMTIMHGCWETGKFVCRSGPCGKDKQNWAFERKIKIPDVFPDGDYVMGYLWYGGIRFSRDVGRFGDFYSCSHVRVKGGAPLSNRRYVPYFEPGSGEFVRNGQCQTSADAVGQCPIGCKSKRTFYAIPRIFRNGNRPAGMTAKDVAAGFNGKVDISGARPTSSNPSSSPPSGVTDKKSELPDSQSEPRTQPKSPQPNNRQRRVMIRNRPAICSGRECCPASCGTCGGTRCHRRPGGLRSCCRLNIRRRARRCAFFDPPCVI